MLDAAPARPFGTALPGLVDILVVNAIEVVAACDLQAAAAAAAALSTRLKVVVVTADGNGVAGCDQSAQHISVPSVPLEVASTHGAGDSFVGTLSARLVSTPESQSVP